MKLYTIGHSAHPIEKFINLLRMYEIRMLVDIRSVPHSRYHPQYRKSALERSLADAGIGYAFLGQSLGGRPEDPTCYPEGVAPQKGQTPWPKPDYDLIMEKPWFRQGIGSLVEIAEESTTALMCSEENPAGCHRHGLVAGHLKRNHPEIQVLHIRASGILVDSSKMAAESGHQLQLFNKEAE